ncbi:MAG: EscU/YscU/HrcU family type III secretion system export apparatus switch protein [Deltaproteobacteria bacterium]|nr:EscU/YscU/HrcU family type III secretion system export apparatus switch protein [Deltaproteobacteria bacterium]
MAAPRRPWRPKEAVALRYVPWQDRAPKVTAKGRGYVAEQIIALARAHSVPISEDPDLVSLLGQLDLDEEIPLAAYPAVAEVLAFVYRLNRAWKARVQSH